MLSGGDTHNYWQKYGTSKDLKPDAMEGGSERATVWELTHEVMEGRLWEL